MAAVILAAGMSIYVWRALAPAAATPASEVVHSLPSFAHAFAFTLLCCAWLARSAAQRLVWCVAWGGIDTLLECMQHEALQPLWAQHAPRLAPWFTGSFALADVAATAAGAAVAWLISNLRKKALHT